MGIPNLSSDQMHSILAELEQALFNHEQWCENLYSTLICHHPPDKRDLEPSAHHNCRFGQWYYGQGVQQLHQHRGFEEIAIEHQRMHQYATGLLQASMNQMPVSIQDYERFVNALKRMRLEITTLRRDIEDTLYNLDPLTGTANRIGMLTKLREERELVKREVHSCCIAMLDLDNFKTVNDIQGHAVADRVLTSFAELTMRGLRPYDKLFRYGGDEFLLCAVDADLLFGRGIVERTRTEFGSISHEGLAGKPFYVTMSAGLTMLASEASVEQSIDRADKALYTAKSSGRNRLIVWEPSMT